ncbi:hypothetical protein BN7_5168 [Wickerhamomyces ciferrii]|uniref:PUM-HD domain-containing protein n=1 Tax=Wickerhamomyces ciferrii (strain ATCC 14091 / BCRC 22168 / CBS 111 / JCM 3599 / NBRC 0793 / NRRL Y-1031 F-60-10) TaxID=1206466 RepID=K0KK00_WICCF|nr:uncharacterized protein BN7_5168 [Wickerhamomyces ciferrii]CCH45585.1 hypothetical protein BN7_5168 [Wickerhamomyces ciferrii]
MGVTNKGTKRSSVPASKPVVKKSKFNNKRSSKVESESEESEQSEQDDSVSESEDELDQSSEDELDQSSEDELDQDEIKIGSDSDDDLEDEEDEEDKEKERDPNKQTSKEQHAEQRKTLAERKLQRKSGAQVQHIKSLWEKLRVKNPPLPKEIRDKLCDEVWNLSKDVIKDLVMKHDASRVVQTLVKYSSKERREAICNALKKHYYELATSSYGKYLLVKLLHYGSKESRTLILDELHGKLRKLMRHREGAYVVEDLYTLYASNEQKKQMIREFWGAEYAVFKDSGKGKNIKEICDENVEKRTLIAKNLSGTITASVEKGSTGFQILHAAMKEYIQIINDDEVREFIELLHEQFAELIHTPEGAEVACNLIARANAKERKQIVRSLKDHAMNLIKNEYGNLVVITLFLTVDDTVLVSKALFGEYIEELHNLITDKYSRRPFLYLLNGLDGRFFSPSIQKELKHYIELSKETSKKPNDQRKQELLEKISTSFYKSIINHSLEILNENIGSQFIGEVFLSNAPADESLKQEAITSIIDSFKGDINDEEHPVNKPFSVRLLKSLIQGGRWDPKTKSVKKVEVSGLGSSFAENFYNEVIGNDLESWILNKNLSFIIVAIYESIEDQKSSRFIKDLKKLKKIVKKADDDNKGAQLLAKIAEF